MGDDIGKAILAIVGGVFVLATISVIVGSSNTPTLVTQTGNALSTVIKAAVSPATSANGNLGLSNYSTDWISSLLNTSSLGL